MSNWFKSQSFGRWLGNGIVSLAILALVTLLALVLPIDSIWAGVVTLAVFFGLPLLASRAPSFLKPYVKRFAAPEWDTKRRLIELTSVVAALLLFWWLVW